MSDYEQYQSDRCTSLRLAVDQATVDLYQMKQNLLGFIEENDDIYEEDFRETLLYKVRVYKSIQDTLAYSKEELDKFLKEFWQEVNGE